MALDANIVSTHGIESLRIDDVLAGWMSDMETARAMTFLAAHVPFGDAPGADVVVHRVAAIAKRAGGTLEIVAGVVLRPPVGAVAHCIGAPHLIFDIPLRRKRIVVVPPFREVSLLGVVDEGYAVEGKVRIGSWLLSRRQSWDALWDRGARWLSASSSIR